MTSAHNDLRVPSVEGACMYLLHLLMVLLSLDNVLKVISIVVTCLQGLSILLNQQKNST